MKKNRFIQGLRGMAFLLIFLAHTKIWMGPFETTRFLFWGNMAVSLFLFLSGYLTAQKYLIRDREQPCELLPLLKGRLRRIGPLHVLTLIASVPLVMIAQSFDLPKLFCNLFLLQAWVPDMAYYYSFNSVSWYLSVFMFLTVLTPFVVKLYRKLNRKGSGILLAVMILLEFAWVTWCTFKALSGDFLGAQYRIYILPPIRALDYLIAIEIALLLEKKERPRFSGFARWTAIPLTLVLFVTSSFLMVFYFLTAAWIFPIALILVLIRDSDRTGYPYDFFKSGWLVWLGNISLELFLIHQLVIRYCELLAEKLSFLEGIPCYVLAFVLSLGLAAAYSRLAARMGQKKAAQA